MTQPIKRGRGQEPVGREGLIPLGEVEVAGEDEDGTECWIGLESVALGREFPDLELHALDLVEDIIGKVTRSFIEFIDENNGAALSPPCQH